MFLSAFRNLRIGAKLSTLIIMGSLGFAVFAGYALYVLRIVQVNGPLYEELTLDHDLIADVLPPPSNLMESFLTASQLVHAVEDHDEARIEALLEEAAALQNEYEARHTYWTEKLDEPSSDENSPEIAQALLVSAYAPAQQYFQVFSTQLVPALRAGDIERSHAVMDEQLAPLYFEHRAALDELVLLQQQDIVEHEAAAQGIVTRSDNLLLLTLIVTIGLAIGVAVLIARTVTAPIVQLTNVAQRIAAGDITVQAPGNTTDEVGILARAFNQMTAQLREILAGLEQRVAARTRDLAIVAEVSTATATILQTERLLNQIVELTKERFNFYHSHIYLLDEAGENLVLTAGAGEPGRIMAAEKRTIPLKREQSLVARAARERQGVVVNDVTTTPDFLPNPLLPHTRSEMAVPLIVGDKVIGVFDVQSDLVGRFTEADVNVQTTLASQVAVSLQNAHQYEETQRRAIELEVAAKVSTAASTILETDRLLQEVVDLTKQAFSLYHAHIYLLNDAGDTLELTSGAGEVGKQMVSEGRRIPLNREQSLVARAARERDGFYVNNVRSDPDFLPHPLLPETQAELAVPMIVAGKVIGVFDVQSSEKGYFTEDDIRIQTTLAAQVAVALQNARSFTRTQKQAKREAMLNTINQKIQGATSVEAVLQIAARELGHALGATKTLAQLNLKNRSS